MSVNTRLLSIDLTLSKFGLLYFKNMILGKVSIENPLLFNYIWGRLQNTKKSVEFSSQRVQKGKKYSLHFWTN